MEGHYEPSLKETHAVWGHIPLTSTQSHCRTRDDDKCSQVCPKKRKLFDEPIVTAKPKMFSDVCPSILSSITIWLIPLTQDTRERILSSLYFIESLQLAC